MPIPVYSSTIRRSEMDAVLTCMVEEKIGPGAMNQKLIKLVKELYSVEGAIVLRSPALALSYALQAFDLPHEAGILLSALAPSWQYLEVLRLGFTPIILDVSPSTGLVTPETIEKGIKDGGRILVLHETLGNIPDMDAMTTLPIPVIEDISLSAGAFYNEKRAGCFGAFAILGLEERDSLTAGGGALLITQERKNALILNNKIKDSPITDFLPDINAALAFVQLKNMTKNIQLRSEMHEIYMKSLLQTRHKPLVFSENMTSSFYSFPVVLETGFKEVKHYVNRKDIEIELAFADSIAAYLNQTDTYPNAASLSLRTVLFPLYPRLGIQKASKVSKVLATLP